MVKYCFLTAESLFSVRGGVNWYWISFSLFSPVIPCMAPEVGGSQPDGALSLAQSIRLFVLLGVYSVCCFVPFNNQITSWSLSQFKNLTASSLSESACFQDSSLLQRFVAPCQYVLMNCDS